MALARSAWLLSDEGHIISDLLLAEKLELTCEINKPRMLQIVTSTPVEKQMRIELVDNAGERMEFICDEIEASHTEEGLIYEVVALDAITELAGDYIADKRPKQVTAAGALAVALEGTRWQIGKVVGTELKDFYFFRKSVYEAVAEIANAYGLELYASYETSGRYINLGSPEGHFNGRRFTWGRDLLGIRRSVEGGQVVTALYGYGKGEETEAEEEGGAVGYGRRISFADINGGQPYVTNEEARKKWGLAVDGDRRHRFGLEIFGDVEDKQELLDLTRKALEKMSTPRVSYTASVAIFAKYGLELGGVGLGEQVHIIDDELGSVSARVVKHVRSTDSEDRVTLGNFVDLYEEQSRHVQETIDRVQVSADTWDHSQLLNSGGVPADKIKGLLDKWNGELNTSGGHVFMRDGEGLLTMDQKDAASSRYATQILSGGMRIASRKKADGSWDWRTIATGEGFLAQKMFADKITGNLIEAGTIRGIHIASRSITADQIATGTITARTIAGKTITAAEIASGTITAREIAASTITAAEIASNAITARHIAVGAITADLITTGRLRARTGGSYFDLDSGHLQANSGYFSGSISASNISQSTMSAGNYYGTGYQMSSNGSIYTGHQEAYSFKYNSGSISSGVNIGSAITVSRTGIRMNVGGKIAVFERTGTAWLGIYSGNPDMSSNIIWCVDNNGKVWTGSDMRLKENLVRADTKEAMDLIREIKLYEFDYRSSGEHRIGAVANFFKYSKNRYAPLVYGKTIDDILGVDYTILSTIALGAIQDIDQRLQRLEAYYDEAS